jgi:hypothetical protein
MRRPNRQTEKKTVWREAGVSTPAFSPQNQLGLYRLRNNSHE